VTVESTKWTASSPRRRNHVETDVNTGSRRFELMERHEYRSEFYKTIMITSCVPFARKRFTYAHEQTRVCSQHNFSLEFSLTPSKGRPPRPVPNQCLSGSVNAIDFRKPSITVSSMDPARLTLSPRFLLPLVPTCSCLRVTDSKRLSELFWQNHRTATISSDTFASPLFPCTSLLTNHITSRRAFSLRFYWRLRGRGTRACIWRMLSNNCVQRRVSGTHHATDRNARSAATASYWKTKRREKQ
jgi:hypothetical protein